MACSEISHNDDKRLEVSDRNWRLYIPLTELVRAGVTVARSGRLLLASRDDWVGPRGSKIIRERQK
ncbi:hypothetical protein J6590_086176 [Homalodisca vitripennis]|nr:hypothetical protein J6590_086176 [Homalodisca vitripennis]